MQKTEKKIACIVFVSLLFLYAALSVFWRAIPVPEAVVENRMEDMYSATRIPPKPQNGGININTASAALLETLPGIGPVIAERIVAHREKYGPFPHPDCIMEVRGIGEAVYAKFADKICAE